ncbi:hypothetical protein BDA99DRAFT_544285 [Phascolomyces articulosus]|uniref:Uncharacterized protein n=1 Tax=Phascolomyces articulosus TaxID=60185 RepID=A0AAD5JLH9_9FUNG|nr:hypothetical protein BDA99DRAFT_544285 [Phascolomyces articulosus]
MWKGCMHVHKKVIKENKKLVVPFSIGDTIEIYQSSIAGTWSGKILDTYSNIILIYKVNKQGTYILKTLDGRIFQKPIIGNHLRIYKLPDAAYHLPSSKLSSHLITEDRGIYSQEEDYLFDNNDANYIDLNDENDNSD